MDDTPLHSGKKGYDVKQLIGRGAYGEVYLAEQLSEHGFSRQVAIKVLNQRLQTHREATSRMRDEARILGRLNHRNIVKVLDLVQIDGRWAVVMDYLPGRDLGEVLYMLSDQSQRFPLDVLCHIGASVAAALDAAHAAQDENGQPMHVIHRDIKPTNIRITQDGQVKVMDFGVARVTMKARETETATEAVLGTLAYLAPERVTMEGDGPAGDIYALCATLLEGMLGAPLGRTPVITKKHELFLANACERAQDIVAKMDGPTVPLIALLREGLGAEVSGRPSAAHLSRQLFKLSRQFNGEGIEVFAQQNCSPLPTMGGSSDSGSMELRQYVQNTTSNPSEVPENGTFVHHTLAPLPTPEPLETLPLQKERSAISSERARNTSKTTTSLITILGLAITLLLLIPISGYTLFRSTGFYSNAPTSTAPVSIPAAPKAVEPVPDNPALPSTGTTDAEIPNSVPKPPVSAKPNEAHSQSIPVTPVEVPRTAQQSQTKVGNTDSGRPDTVATTSPDTPVSPDMPAQADPGTSSDTVTEETTQEPKIVSTPVQPLPVATKPPLDFRGTWSGTVGGRPFQLSVVHQNKTQISATVIITLGSTARSISLEGSATSEGIVLRGENAVLRGTLDGASMKGTWTAGKKTQKIKLNHQ